MSGVLQELLEADLSPDPFEQFTQWFREAQQFALVLPEAMTLSTVSPTGEPSARIVLLKSFDRSGFVFYMNYESQKGRDLDSNPRASLLFHWREIERQVRISGTTARVAREESAEYFATRPRDSQIGAWASPQSSVIPSRETLEAKALELEKLYKGRPVPLPPFWGGVRLAPVSIEFWQGRQSRLHDRLRYRKVSDGWVVERLAP